ncbi:MAG: zinc dependent phospholipase C family protein [Flavobacteriales bacterium]|nr:zinc dependent phospholipase C family protein [Flavobacteriales bacterium]
MPGAFSHLALADRLREHCRESEFSPIHSQPEHFNWGSMGPDVLFFHPDDWIILKDYFELLFGLYDCFDEILDLYKKLRDTYENIIDWKTGGVYSELQRTTEALKITITSFAAKLLTDKVDFFEIIKPPMHAKPGEHDRKNWWWIDIGHHYRTGDLANTLAAKASNVKQKSYAFGYAAHIGADVIGHPYVNVISSGPYRNHWRRHVLVEKVIDTYLWQHWNGERLSSSRAYRKLQTTPGTGFSIEDSFCNYLSDCFNSVYEPLGKAPITDEQVHFMFSTFYRWVRDSSKQSTLNLPKPELFDWFDLPETIRDRISQLQSSQPSVQVPSGALSLGSIKRFLRSIAELALWSLEVAVSIVLLPEAVIANLSATGLRYLNWLALRAIYDLSYNVRLSLSLAGYVHPEPEMLSTHFGKIVNPSEFLSLYTEVFPHERYHNSNQTYHLIHPLEIQVNNPEYPRSNVLPAFPLNLPEGLFEGWDDAAHINALLSTPTLSSIEKAIDSLRNLQGLSVCPFAKHLMNRIALGTNDIPNWNLDGDRGYGWPTWKTSATKPWSNLSDFSII